jgi:hypothetical protein
LLVSLLSAFFVQGILGLATPENFGGKKSDHASAGIEKHGYMVFTHVRRRKRPIEIH